VIRPRRRPKGPAPLPCLDEPRCGALLRIAIVTACVLLQTATAHGSVLDTGLALIERNYLFADELDAPRLLGSALSYLEARVPEAVVEEADGDARVLVVGPCRLRLEPAPGSSVKDLEPLLRKAAAVIDECVSERPDELPSSESLLLSGVLSGLDPYSAVFDAERKAEHTIQFQGTLAGIGARIGVRHDKLTLISVYEGSPAALAGLHDNDVVRRIDDVSTTNMPVDDAVGRIRGEVGSTVRLEVERAGKTDAELVSIQRGLVTIPSVKVEHLPDGILYAAVSHFSQTTPTDFRSRVSEAIAEVPTTGIVIDLRANSGGSMLGAAAIADMFIDDGILITTAGRGGARVSGLTPEVRATRDTPFRDLTVAILTSPRTASGSELLAASLRTHDRVVLVGERTFGKGTVQKTYALSNDSSLKMTVGHFLPNGFAIPGGGLMPDLEFRSITFEGDHVWVSAEHGDNDLPFWLRTPPWLKSANGTPRAVVTLVEHREPKPDDDGAAEGEKDEAEPEPSDEEPKADDPIVKATAEMLARFGRTSAEQTLLAASAWLDQHVADADHELAGLLSQRGLDWEQAPARSLQPADAVPRLEVKIEPENGSLTAGTRSNVVVTATNTGSTPLYRVFGRLESEAGFLDGHGVLLGHLGVGESRSWTVSVEPPPFLHTSRYPVRLAFHEDGSLPAKSGYVHLAIDGIVRPQLAHRISVVPAAQPGKFNVRVDVRNRGKGAAEEVRAFLKRPDTDAIELGTATAKLEALEPGTDGVLDLEATLLKSVEKPVELELVLSESRFRTFYTTHVALVAQPEYGAWEEAPEIRLRKLLPDEGSETFKVVAEATDDEGLANLWCRVDGKKIDYIDAKDDPRRRLRVELPWRPSDESQRVEIIATDADGRTSVYLSDL